MNGAGEGTQTNLKESAFGSALKRSIDFSKAGKCKKWPFYYGDLNAGPGWNSKSQCPGTPRIALPMLSARRPDHFAFVCDNNQSYIDTLFRTRVVGADNRVVVFKCSNHEMLEVFAEFVRARENPKFAIGAIICDPNGYFGSPLSFRAVETFAKEFKRIDLLINLNYRTFRLGRGLIKRALGKQPSDRNAEDLTWIAKDWPKFCELPTLLHRSNGLVQIRSGKGDLFVLLELRGMRCNNHRNLGLHDINSSEGRSILNGVDPK